MLLNGSEQTSVIWLRSLHRSCVPNELLENRIIKLTNLINTALRIKYIPLIWKVAEAVKLLQPGTLPHKVSSCGPISLLPLISKIFENILLKKLKIETKSHTITLTNKSIDSHMS